MRSSSPGPARGGAKSTGPAAGPAATPQGMRTETPAEVIRRLVDAWRKERETARRRSQEERAEIPWKERIERGLAAADLTVDETFPSPGQRVIVVVRSGDPRFTRERMRVRPGDPVVLFHHDPAESTALHAVVERWRGPGLGLALDDDLPDAFEDRPFRLEREAPEATFNRGDRALARLEKAHGEVGQLVAVGYGLGTVQRVDHGAVPLFDTSLDAAQNEAVQHALGTIPFALVHGPPGTGKTRCLVEIIRQMVARGERVLAVAPSNVAVDNLVERLVAANVPALRLGHPARVLPEVEVHTLAYRLDQHEATRLTRGWIQEANALKRRTEAQAARGTGDRQARREAFAEARRLLKDARAHLRRVEAAMLSQAPVVCATLTGAWEAWSGLSRDDGAGFGVVVLDEATQAVDPLAWIPLAMAPRAILAGDPHQLAPTVIDAEAQSMGLGTTLFDRLYQRLGPSAVRMLVTQHRMHADIMAFPSAALYEGRLVPAPSVAAHRLEDLLIPPGHPALAQSPDGAHVLEDPLRPGARVFIDTAGAGFAETQRQPDRSTMNPEMAQRTAAEVRRLLSRGVPASAVAVLTPYDAQVGVLRGLLATEVESGLEVGSIDSFQGREKEAIVLDLVRQNDDAEIGFLRDIRRMNVALTRARRFLILVGDSATLGQTGFYAKYLADVELRGAWVSVFSDPAEIF